MSKHPILGWSPPLFTEPSWHQQLDDTLARGLTSAARKFIEETSQERALDFRHARIAVLRSFSLELSQALLSLAFMRWRILPEFHWFAFNTFEPELLDPESKLRSLHREQPFDFVLLAWRLKDWIPEAWGNPTTDARAAVVAGSLARIESILEAAERIAPVVSFSFDDHPVDAPVPAGRLVQEALITEHHSHVLTWCAGHAQRAAAVSLRGRISLDRKTEAFSHQPYTIGGQVQLALALAHACAPWLQPSAKVLVLDADDTLWGGILGEDGVSGVQIGSAFPGNLYWELQLRAKFLANNGVLLAMVSKNDQPLVRELFRANPRMPLGWQDFSSRVINWDEKSTGIRRVAEELNLGLSSLVFLDDSPFERALVRAVLPGVRVPETPDILAMLDYLENGPDFLIMSRTAEDLGRAADYAAQRQRQEAQASAPSTEAFLRDLELVATVYPWTRETLSRIAQMLQKTNQFNLTTRRHSLSQLEGWLASSHSSPSWQGWTLAARDRFADQGIVGCLLAKALEKGQWEIDSFLLSCRALGRGYEIALLSCGLQGLKDMGATSVLARYFPTQRNEQVRDFYLRHGACLMSEGNGESVYRFDLTDRSSIVRVPEWVRLERTGWE